MKVDLHGWLSALQCLHPLGKVKEQSTLHATEHEREQMAMESKTKDTACKRRSNERYFGLCSAELVT